MTCRVSWFWFARLFLSFLLPCVVSAFNPVTALDPAKRVTQYGHDAWQTEQGLPQNSVTAILQTRDGYLWLGTQEGLVRFDGVKFTVFDKSNTPAFTNHFILSLCEDRLGRLWIGTYGGGLVCLDQGKFSTYTRQDGLSNEVIRVLCEDQQGNLWIGTDRGLNRLTNGRFKVFISPTGSFDERISAVAQDRDGNLWVGFTSGVLTFLHNDQLRFFASRETFTDASIRTIYSDQARRLWVGTDGKGLFCFAGDEVTTYTTHNGLSDDSVIVVYEDRRGNLWIGTGNGLNRLNFGQLTTYSSGEGLTDERVLALAEDAEGSLWIGTDGGGLNRFCDTKFTVFSTAEGLSNSDIISLCEDNQNTLWIATSGGGVNCLKDGKVITTYTTHDGLSNNDVSSICATIDGGVWVGTSGGGLNYFKDGKIQSHLSTANGLTSNFIWSIFQAHDSTLWVGTNTGLNHIENGRITRFTQQEGLSNNVVWTICEDSDHTLWVGTDGGGLNQFKDGKIRVYTTQDGLSNNFVVSLYHDTQGSLWIGTAGGGLNRYHNGKFTTFTSRDGLFDDTVYQILEDNQNCFWMSSNKGIFRIQKSQLEQFARQELKLLECTVFSKADGLRSSECNGGVTPAGWKTHDGKLWFPTIKGVAMIDPAQIHLNVQVIPVRIEQVLVDSQPVSPLDQITFKAGVQKVEFHFTGLSYRVPSRVKFRFKLDGYDPDWTTQVGPRVAYYTRIPAGEYTFQVVACNDDGVWNTTGSSVKLTVKPHFYQTYWFYGLCILGVVATGGLLYSLRVAQLKRRQRILEELVEKRTWQLEKANQELQRLSYVDALTGVANRRHFDEVFNLEWRRAIRAKTPISIILIDVDSFKLFNDTYGHQGGDECLRRIGQVLKETVIRAGDIVARYGGEEFVAVLPGSSTESACNLAEILRTRTESLQIPHEKSLAASKMVTLSQGIATVVPRLDLSPESLIQAADQALYQAKHQGRNCVRVAQTVPDHSTNEPSRIQAE